MHPHMQIAGTLTAYQINDILEEPFWLEDTQLKTVSIIIPVHRVLEIGCHIGNCV